MSSYIEEQIDHYFKLILSGEYCAILWKPSNILIATTYYLFTKSPRADELLQMTTCEDAIPTGHIEFCLKTPAGYDLADLENINEAWLRYHSSLSNKEQILSLLSDDLEDGYDLEFLCCKEITDEVEEELSSVYGIKLDAIW